MKSNKLHLYGSKLWKAHNITNIIHNNFSVDLVDFIDRFIQCAL